MRGPILPGVLLAAVVLAASACGPGEPAPPPAARPGAPQTETPGHAETLRALRDVEAAIAEAREAVRTAEASGAASRAQALHVSDIRRGIVVANVSVQKAREALGREDDAAARRALEGSAARLRAVVSGKAGGRALEGPQRRQ